MSPLFTPFLFLGLAAAALPLCAAPATQKPVKPNIQTAPNIKIGDIKPGDIRVVNKGEPTGKRFRIHMSLNPTGGVVDSDHGQTGDSCFDTYGSLQIDGVNYWTVARNNDYRKLASISGHFVPNNVSTEEKATQYGYSLTKPSKFNKNQKFEFDSYKDLPQSQSLHVVLKLYDADAVNGDRSRDDLFGNFDFKIDLSKGPASYYYFWKDGNGNGSDLFVHAEPIKDLYDSQGSKFPKPEVGPIIEKPKFPGKGPGPGPLIKNKPLVR